jgi:hypothetical protein
VDTTTRAESTEVALEKLNHIAAIQDIHATHLEKLRASAPSSVALSSGAPLARLNDILAKHKISLVDARSSSEMLLDDDIPF